VAKVVKPVEVVEVNQLLAKLHDKAFDAGYNF
jgi:predicted hydrolase (HD superfamily)